MAQLQDPENNLATSVALGEDLEDPSALRQKENELLLSIKTLLYFMSLTNLVFPSEEETGNHNENAAKTDDVGAEGGEGDETDEGSKEDNENGEKSESGSGEDDGQYIPADFLTIDIIEEVEGGTFLGISVDGWINMSIYFAILILLTICVWLINNYCGAKKMK
ncbi:hypothetical protein JTB14_037970 [Gonioctena quinquepunctata]|nr:hypothetical protein JTB14_037970 [Gonioctena quinquepunctata]